MSRDRTALTYRYECLRAVAAGIVETASGTFLLLIAVSWFNPSLKVLRPEDLDRAIHYLGLTDWERLESARVLKELEKGLGVDVVRLSKLPLRPHDS